MKIRIGLVAIICLLGCAANSLAQTPEVVAEKRSEMKKIERLAGRWEGSGWIQMGRTRENFKGSENVQSKLDGTTLLVEGKFSNDTGKVVHETLAVLTYDPSRSSFRFDTFLASGLSGQYDFKAVGDHFEWGFQIAAGTVRYTIYVNDETWSEIGEFSRDGKTWMKTFEMTLKRGK